MTVERGSTRSPVRLVDVAREAGVSPQTVSNVVNGRDVVAEPTRRRVLAAIEKSGYRPHRAAVHLRTRRSGQLGLHLPPSHLSVRDTFTVSFLRELIDAVERAGRQLVVFTHPLDDASQGNELLASGVDGFVLFNVDPSDPRPRALARTGIPFAVFGRTDPDLPHAWADIDNAGAMTDVVDHLVLRGHRRIGYVGHAGSEYWSVDRLRGVRSRLAQHGLEIPVPWLVQTTLDAAPAAITGHLLGADRPDAVICSSDSLALVALTQASHAGLRPGTDIAITGFDALPLPVDVDPTLTSVALPVTAAADALVRLVLDQIEGRPAPEHGVVLPTHLVVGGSG